MFILVGEIVITQPVAEEERKPTAVLSLPRYVGIYAIKASF